ncbi:transposon Tf2-9 polyprotein [Trichonephila clavipes]|nr:transposon Tf2-9 polyprotein [Trichonephila clavipes]
MCPIGNDPELAPRKIMVETGHSADEVAYVTENQLITVNKKNIKGTKGVHFVNMQNPPDGHMGIEIVLYQIQYSALVTFYSRSWVSTIKDTLLDNLWCKEVKIPPYNFNDPQLWFSTCERTFALGVPKAITDTGTKFNYIVSNLPPEAAAIVRDLIITPDETDPYGGIKAQVIQRTGEKEIRKLLTGEELGDRMPSELLRTMNRLAASHNVPKELML